MYIDQFDGTITIRHINDRHMFYNDSPQGINDSPQKVIFTRYLLSITCFYLIINTLTGRKKTKKKKLQALPTLELKPL